MKGIYLVLMIALVLGSTTLFAQKIKLVEDRLQAVDVSMTLVKLKGKKAVRVVKDTAVKAFDEPTFVKISGANFTNGTIEVKVLSRLLKNAPEFARGFIGVAFRINETNTSYESIYIRPTNGRSDDQVRRNHSIQYYSYPHYKFDRLRKEAPERYESYADMGLDEWITLQIVVQGQQAKLYLNDSKQPSLVVNDLKLGANASGAIGLWVEVGTEGFFSDLKIHHQ
ncbi:hypothetical protein [Telluribacter humicola]